MLTLNSPLRRELRELFKAFDLVEEVCITDYPRSRLYQWVYRFGWKATITQTPDGLIVRHTGGEGPVEPIQERGHRIAALRERLDKLVVEGAFFPEGFTDHQVVQAMTAFTDKQFRLRMTTDGQEIVRVA